MRNNMCLINSLVEYSLKIHSEWKSIVSFSVKGGSFSLGTIASFTIQN